MKIGFLGNANNYPFMLARALRKMGHNVLFIVDRNVPLNRPENRYEDIELPYPEWIYDASPLDLWSYPASSKRTDIVRLLQGCDAVFLNEYGLSLSPDIKKPTIALLTGTDLEVLANNKYLEQIIGVTNRFKILLLNIFSYEYRRRRHYFRSLISAQRAGIRTSVAVNYFPKGILSTGDALLNEIGVKDSQRIFFMMTDLDKIKFVAYPNNKIVRIFCVARLTWKKPTNSTKICELDYKGSDIMVRGLGLFLQRTGFSLDIRLVKKGKDIDETMALVQAAGLDSQVTWLNEMSQLDVLEEYRQADIVFDHFGNGSIGMGALDAMATGRPVIANCHPEILERATGVECPICQASNPEEICAQLQSLVPDRAERERIGTVSRRYVEQYFSADRGASICLNRLDEYS